MASVQLSHGPFLPIVQSSHWSPGCSGSHPSWGWMSQQYKGLWVSSFLEFPVLISKWVTNRLWTGTSAQTTLFHCHNQSLQQPSENHTIPTSTFRQRHWSTVGFPTLRAHTHQVAELESKPSQCPEEPVFAPDSRACASPHVLVPF